MKTRTGNWSAEIPHGNRSISRVFVLICILLATWTHPAFAGRSPAPDASKDPVGAALFKAVHHLAERIGPGPEGRRWRVCMDKIIHADLHFPSPASGYLRERLESLMQDDFDLMARSEADLNQAMQEINASMGDAFDAASKLDAGTFLSCEIMLRGSYRISSFGGHVVYP